MTARVFYDDDADLSHLKGKTIAIIGYGSQGHAQAQNLRDSGCNVLVGQRKGGANYDLAVEHGFKPVSAAEAAEAGDLVNILLPDELQGRCLPQRHPPEIKAGQAADVVRTALTSILTRSCRRPVSMRRSSPPRDRGIWSAVSMLPAEACRR